MTLPVDKGTYILILKLAAARTIEIGRLGKYRFDAGYYAYVGSAFGPGGLRGRLSHHLKVSSRPHWHIDYLRQATQMKGIWLHEASVREEHTWADRLRQLPGATLPVPGFGSSDCDCASHLIYFEGLPDAEAFQARIGDTVLHFAVTD